MADPDQSHILFSALWTSLKSHANAGCRPAGRPRQKSGENELFCSFNCLGLSFSCCAFEGNNNLDKRDIRSYIYYWVGDCIYVGALVDYSYTVIIVKAPQKSGKSHIKNEPPADRFLLSSKKSPSLVALSLLH